ncbi:WSC domain-containing protein [Xylariaceae sp. FL1272]|nr:WSC domain-containing protein [Xylariaceae sp. FL1272]
MFTTTHSKALVGFSFALRASAFWRLPCSSPVVVERIDPIIDPGIVSRHTHTVMGSNALNFTMDYDLTQTATCSTCKAVEDLSSYWVPSLYYHAENGSFIPVPQGGGALIYYLQRTDQDDPNPEEGLIAFPKDLRIVAGDPMNRNYTDTPEQNAVSFVCLGVEGPATFALPKQNCPNGLRTQLIMPSCWDGKNLDSEDHKSHMAYPSGVDHGPCPQTHPKRFITIFYEVTWSVDAFKDMWYGDRQPFVFSNGDPTGYGYHGDFLNGWDIPTLQKAINECNADSGVIEECGAFTFRTDEDMAACKVLPRVNEDVSGVLGALPGCNPVQDGPEIAVMETDCGAVTQIGDPMLPFTDVREKLGWKYVACAKDPAGQSRTLDGFSLDQTNMTIEYCIETCSNQNYKYAGVEYKTQCFCGNDIAEDRMPTNGTIGDCSLPCSGDATQLCGGAALVSIYTHCDDAKNCHNGGLPDSP